MRLIPSPPSSLSLQTSSQATRHCAPEAVFVPVHRNKRRRASRALTTPGGSTVAPMAYVVRPPSMVLISTTLPPVLRRRAFQLARYLSTLAMSGVKSEIGSLMLDRFFVLLDITCQNRYHLRNDFLFS